MSDEFGLKLENVKRELDENKKETVKLKQQLND